MGNNILLIWIWLDLVSISEKYKNWIFIIMFCIILTSNWLKTQINCIFQNQKALFFKWSLNFDGFSQSHINKIESQHEFIVKNLHYINSAKSSSKSKVTLRYELMQGILWPSVSLLLRSMGSSFENWKCGHTMQKLIETYKEKYITIFLHFVPMW